MDQKARARKIAENAGEDTEKKNEKLEWIYGQKENDEEEYLLGKKVKDELDFCRQEEKRVEDSFGSIYSQSVRSSTLQVDMAAKLREDPMAFIRKNDDDAWRLIYDNPVKMAQLRTILRPMMLKKKRKEARQRRREEKETGGKNKQSQDDRKKKKKKRKEAQSSSSSEDSSSDESSDDETKRKRDGKRRSESGNRDERSSPDRKKNYGLVKRGGLELRGAADSSAASTHKFIERRDKEREVLQRNQQRRIEKKKVSLTEEEMEERRRQMTEDAKWRDVQRSTNIKRYEEEDKKERAKEREGRDHAGHFEDSTQPDFVRPLVKDAYQSAEDRIKRNIYSVQRSRADQDKHFTKR